MKPILFFIFSTVILFAAAQKNTSNPPVSTNEKIIPGAERLSVYVPMLKGKKVGIFANQTSMVGRTHLVDTLQKLGINVTTIFGPEHGFRGTADAGEHVGNYIDEKTGVTVVSL